MHEKVLESAEYPEILYTCSNVSASKTGEGQYWAALNGDLTLRMGRPAASTSPREFH